MNDRFKNITIAILSLVSITLLLLGLFFLRPKFGDGNNKFIVRFTNIDKIRRGTRVTYAGKPVGEVISITQIENDHTQLEDIYPYELTLEVDSKIRVYDTDAIQVNTSGLMGERSIAILPKPTSQQRELLTLNTIAYASSEGSLSNTMTDISTVAEKTGKTFETLNLLLDTNQVNIEKSVASIAKASEDLVNGNGTFGKLLTDEAFYIKLQTLLSRADILLNDINHYGILFHLDKSWQRNRRKPIAEIDALTTNEDLKTYIDAELSKITLSVGRLKIAIAEKEKRGAKDEKTISSGIYRDLLERIKYLEETTKEAIQE